MASQELFAPHLVLGEQAFIVQTSFKCHKSGQGTDRSINANTSSLSRSYVTGCTAVVPYSVLAINNESQEKCRSVFLIHTHKHTSMHFCVVIYEAYTCATLLFRKMQNYRIQQGKSQPEKQLWEAGTHHYRSHTLS